MRLSSVLLAGALSISSAFAQETGPASPPSSPSSASTSKSSGQGTNTSSATAGQTRPSLPVSLDKIREGLKKQATDSLLKRTDIPVDFRIHIIEQQKLDDMLSKLDFKSGVGPIPAGGIYAYEQQRRLFNPVNHPLAQPYSAFSSGELITIALQNLLVRYLGGALVDSIGDAERAQAERAAREEVARDVEAYCSRRPDRARIEICTRPVFR